ncbi:MAG: aspartate-semialdehyde dehydrogenase [Bacteroidales bacterium]|jgi:aspartate-semialdehyde dehydrogenase|nr:aspartate-semialdehyde dehydrogenase [Bacteroidales bacterium]
MKLALIGATGLVGKKMLEVIAGQALQFEVFLPVASEQSLGKKIIFRQKAYPVITAEQALDENPELVLMSAGTAVSRRLAPLFVERGAVVIDNSSAWRRDADKALVVPEINADILKKGPQIIANPNCSTIQLVMALAPIHKVYGLKRLVLSTYQSVSGSGQKGVQQLENEEIGEASLNPAYPYPIHRNVIPHGGFFEADGYTSEEDKLVFETRKILNDTRIAVTATVVRVPVIGGHSISANIETYKPFKLDDIRALIQTFPGVVLQDNPAQNSYPMPLSAAGHDEVFVGRLRRDHSIPNGLNLWIVADNLRKGAATNAVQIAKYLIDNNLI